MKPQVLGIPKRVSWRVPAMSPSQALVLGFAALILIGAALLSLPAAGAGGRSVGVVNALFTATSAVCVTGLVVLDTARDFSPFGQAVILVLIQAGGLGIAILSTLVGLAMGRRISLRERVILQESLGHYGAGGVVRLVRTVVLATAAIEGAGALVLFLRFAGEHPPGKALWLAVFHAVSAFCNAGFDLFSTSLRRFQADPLVLPTVALLIFLGGIGFTVIEDLVRARGAWHRLSLHSRVALATSALLIVAGALLYLALESSNPRTLGSLPPAQRLLVALFTAVTPRTAGFEAVPTGSLTEAALLLTIVLMFIGASPGGTGGGIKTTTFAALALAVWSAVRGDCEVRVGHRRVPAEVVHKVSVKNPPP